MSGSRLCACCKKENIPKEYSSCPFCGWVRDDFQEENPDLDDHENNLSLNEYQKRIEKLIGDNPDWRYNYKNDDDMRYLGVIE